MVTEHLAADPLKEKCWGWLIQFPATARRLCPDAVAGASFGDVVLSAFWIRMFGDSTARPAPPVHSLDIYPGISKWQISRVRTVSDNTQ